MASITPKNHCTYTFNRIGSSNMYDHARNIVKVSPTWKPQSLNAMRRLERVLVRNLLTRSVWRKEQGNIYRLGHTRIYFLSGQPTANVVGATANLLLSCDEAQDVLISKWDKDFNPMAASTYVNRVGDQIDTATACLLGHRLDLPDPPCS